MSELTVKDLDNVGLGDRAKEYLLEAEITKFDQLVGMTKKDLVALKGIGEKTADDILDAVAAWEERATAPEVEPEEAIAQPLEAESIAIAQGEEATLTSEEGEPAPAVEQVEVPVTLTDFVEQEVRSLPPDQQVIDGLTEALCWTADVFQGQTRGQQGMKIAGLIRQSVLKIRPDLTPQELDDIKGALPVRG